jgi:LSD1 subclass zinc finger protein
MARVRGRPRAITLFGSPARDNGTPRAIRIFPIAIASSIPQSVCGWIRDMNHLTFERGSTGDRCSACHEYTNPKIVGPGVD